MRLIDRNWKAELDQCAAAATGPVTIVCPFVKDATLANLLASIGPQHPVRLLTRFSLRDAAAGVSDFAAMQRVLDAGGAVRGVRGLHAKVYVFGDQAVVTSANLTARGLGGNQEFGCVSDDAAFVATCTVYTDRLWDAAGPNLTAAQLHDWDAQVTAARLKGATVPLLDDLPDHGADVRDEPGVPGPDRGPAPLIPIDWPAEGQGFVKIFGEGDSHAPLERAVHEELDESRAYAWCTYSVPKRPRRPRDGDTMFLSRLTPDGLRIYGRVLVMEHDEDRDVATPAEIARRPWLERFPLYVRVFRVEVLDGTLANGIPIADLVTEMGTDAFVTTRERARAGQANINPNLSMRQQPDVRLTPEATEWCHRRLQAIFDRRGRLSDELLDELRAGDDATWSPDRVRQDGATSEA